MPPQSKRLSNLLKCLSSLRCLVDDWKLNKDQKIQRHAASEPLELQGGEPEPGADAPTFRREAAEHRRWGGTKGR